MTRPAPRSFTRAAIFAGAIGLVVSVSLSAQAFTFQDADGSAAGTSRGFKDLDIPKVPDTSADSRFKSGESGTFKYGNSTFQFGGRSSFDQKYDPSNMFNPYYREGRW